MADNIVLLAVRQNPKILRQIVSDPIDGERNPFANHEMSIIERMAFDNIERQAFGRRRFARATDARHAYYRKFTTREEREALRLEVKYMQYSFLKGWQLYEEIARVMSIKFRKLYTWREVKGMLEYTSEVIADIELNPNRRLRKAA